MLVLYIALAGAAGTLSRYGLTVLVQSVAGAGFPFATLVVNCVGCFGFGLVWSATEDAFPASEPNRLILLTGFMGAFTTFSTFIFETASRWTEQPQVAVANLLLSNVVGLILLLVGMSLGKRI